MTWKEGFLRQAESDYEVYRALGQRKVALCHRLHYLQMASEKLAKSFLCHGSQRPSKKTHYVLVRFLNLTKLQPKVARLLNYDSNNHLAYCAYIDSLLDVASRVEDLAPAGGSVDKMNPEYPWEDTSGCVLAPVEYAFSEFSQPDLAKLQTLISNLFRIAHEL